MKLRAIEFLGATPRVGGSYIRKNLSVGDSVGEIGVRIIVESLELKEGMGDYVFVGLKNHPGFVVSSHNLVMYPAEVSIEEPATTVASAAATKAQPKKRGRPPKKKEADASGEKVSATKVHWTQDAAKVAAAAARRAETAAKKRAAANGAIDHAVN